MKKVLLLKGLPASGKSTYAKDLIDTNPGKYKRINKDDLRSMLDNSKWSKDNEKFILKTRNMMILAALEAGKHVIVDDTNFGKHEARITELVKGKATVITVRFFDVTPEECIKRDLKRTNSVGSEVIMRMYNQFLKPEVEQYVPSKSLPKAVIFDVDGTLAHMVGRRPYDWKRVGEDEVDIKIALLADLYVTEKYKVIILTGRDGVCLPETKEWLKKHNIVYDDIFIREAGDNRKDAIIKWEIFLRDIATKYNVELIVDDRDQVVDMWRSRGIKCLQVQSGNF